MLRNNKNIIKEYHAVFTKEMIKESLFVLDANCLLFPLKDYIIGDKILTALESIKGRTYIPFITQVEFLENEITVLADRKGNIARSDKAIHEIKDKDKLLNLEIRNHIQNKLFNSIEKVKNEDNMRSLYKKIVKFKKQYFEQIEGVLDKVDDFLQDIEKELLLKKK
ncbi:Uncharacterised protein [Streptococcus acidominimus]|uniref:PIN like domain-containing protein n=1 Tax=Streptococcus acidominimus TaxID=1326 RepID=A0A380JKA6_STRAI|nr:PIN-like domain-containing protein [Streptococcus acidominimus]SUN40917.1 Uncharacterised protein [Streptococcus acidominimus]